MEKILVTGATGYIGMNVIQQLLEKNFCVAAAVRNKAQATDLQTRFESSSKLTFRLGELPEQIWPLNNIDCIVHCAALLIKKNKADLFKVNVDGTWALLQAAKKHQVKKFIYLSSQSVYGTKGECWNEKMPTNPESLYALSKLAGEYMCADEEFKEVQTVALRIPRIYGLGQNLPANLLPHFYAKLVAEEKPLPLYTQNTNTVSYLHINDLTNAIEKVIKTEVLSEHSVFNISAGQAITNENLATICQALAKTFGLKKPELTLIDASAPISIDSYMDPTLANNKLGWSADTSLEGGIKQLIKHAVNSKEKSPFVKE